MNKNRTVLVAGFFDLFHSGHARFLERAAEFGKLTVVIGSDENSQLNKNKTPIYTQDERQYIIQSLACVSRAIVPQDTSSLNFKDILIEQRPDFFVINEDGDKPEKRALCETHGVEYVVLKREPRDGLPERSSTAIREIDRIPHRLDLSGFYDQQMLNSVIPGAVVILPIDTLELDDRSGMSSSTRKQIRRIFGNQLPPEMPSEELARIIFAVENPPGSQYISGAVDALGLVVQGVNKFDFQDSYWPHHVESINDEETLRWLDSCISLVQTRPRPPSYAVMDGNEDLSPSKIQRLRDAAEATWQSIHNRNTYELGDCINEVHEAQQALFPGYVSPEIQGFISKAKEEALGVKLAGAGGFGYMIQVAENPPDHAIRIKSRRAEK